MAKPTRTGQKHANRGAEVQRELLLRIFDEAYNKTAWHGPNLLGSIRRVPAPLAMRKPGRVRHRIAEITIHCAYWKYTMRRRLLGEKRGSFALKGSNWFELPPRLTDAQWRGYKTLLQDEHDALRSALASMQWPDMVARFPSESKFLEQAYGVAMHDTYHAGQIQTIKAMLRGGAPSR